MVQNNKTGSKSIALNTSNLLGCFMFLAIILIFSPRTALCSLHEISEVFIEASGNNKYEAKIKAHEQGMMRAFLLVADNMGIKNTDIKEIPYTRLKKVFKAAVLYNELNTVDKYNATVTYKYDKAAFYQLLLDFGNVAVNEMFYECLVLPVFKQRNVINIWDKEKRWNDVWADSRDALNKHKILYPTKSLFASKKINPDNVFHLTYDDFIEIFPNFLFKKVIIITTEYFTNRKTGEGLMKVGSYVLRHNTAENMKLEEEYTLASLENIKHNVDFVINKTIANYGAARTSAEVKLDQQNVQAEEEDEPKPIVMDFEVFNQEEMNTVVDKLKKVEQIDKYLIEHDYDTRYKILIYTTVSEFELAEGLYLNGLSYKIHGNLYSLIDVKKGS